MGVMGRLKAILTSRVALGTAMGFYGQLVQLLIQLVSVPLFTAHWGLEGYGTWLIMSTLPGLFAMADLGFTVVGANSMVAAMATGDRDRAVNIYHALRLITLAVGSALLLLACLAALLVPIEQLGISQDFTAETIVATTLILSLYGVIALANGVTLAGFRAADSFAFSGTVFQTIILIEAGCAWIVLLNGGGPVAVALAFLIARILGTVVLSYLLGRRAAWLRGGQHLAWRAEIRALVRPALAAAALPAGHAVVMQGTVMALGAIAGPGAVPAFTVTRTLSRTALQFGMRFNMAAMPQFTIASTRGDRERVGLLVRLNILVITIFIIPAAGLIAFLGQPIIFAWSGGRVLPDEILLQAMALAMIGNAAWMPLSNLLLATNRHETFSYAFVIMAALAVSLGAVLSPSLGALGMAIALIALEFSMAAWVFCQCYRVGLQGGHGFTPIAAIRGSVDRRRARDRHPR